MSRPASIAGTDRLLHASPQRTVFATVDEESGERVVCKLFVSGGLADAERELVMAKLCAGPGVVPHLDARIDAATNRPCITTVFVAGRDLAQLIAERGALPAAFACELLAPVAETLASMHELRVAEAPRGVCHGDVKPTNLLRTDTTTLLLDFEHALPIAGSAALPAGPTFSGGTHGFAPPEAARGVTPDASFDVFALGATLQWLVTGGGAAELPQRTDASVLVAACTAADPRNRPSAREAAAALRELASRGDDADEVLLDALARGEPPAVADVGANVRQGMLRAVSRRRRLLDRFPRLLDVPRALPTEPHAVSRELATAARVLKWFPRHTSSLRWRRELCIAGGHLLGEAAQQVNSLRRSEDFAAAALWLRDAEEMTNTLLALPGGCPIPLAGPPATAGPLHRQPLRFLRHLGEQLETARQELAAENEVIATAKSRLDIDAAARAIDALAARYGGSSPTATRQRDRLHRLGFYIERIARAQPNVERVGPLWDAVALAPLTELVATAAASSRRRTLGEGTGGVVGLRSLQVTLVNLAEEFPRVTRAAPAIEALTQALAHLTDQGWQLLAEAEKYLRTVPVPVRPLQVALSRLDTYRILEAFIDRPDRPRGRLQDSLESLRLRLDQARSARDRLAEGAENAMARGHWTTGLFDMERAIAELSPFDERERVEAARLETRLAEARRLKQEVEAAVRRNVELATRYGTMQDDPSTSFAERLQVLAERRDCLHLLSMHVPSERVALYGNDLRDVETQINLEEAAAAEHELDSTVDPFERLRIGRRTLDQLSTFVTTQGEDAPGRLVRQLEHWRTTTAHCQRAVEQFAKEREAARRHQRRLVGVALAAAIVCTVAIGIAVRSWFDVAPAQAATRLDERTAALPTGLLPTARALAAAASWAAAAGPSLDVHTWHQEWARALTAYADQFVAEGSPAAAREFAVSCWDEALAAAREHIDAAGRQQLELLTAALVAALQRADLRPTQR